MSSYGPKSSGSPGKVEGNPFIYHDLMNDDKVEVEDLKVRYRAGTWGCRVKQVVVRTSAGLECSR